MLKLGLQKKTESEKLIKPGVITDNLWLRHSYNDGKAQTVGEGCVTLDGTGDFMSLDDITDFDGEEAIAFAMWIKLADTNMQPLITKGLYNTSGDAFVWQYDPGTSSGQMQFSIGNSVTGTLNSCNLTTDGTKWHHVAVTYAKSRSEIFFYIDGVQTAGTTSGSFVDIPNVSEPIGFGLNGNGSELFCGSMCQINIWKGTPVPTEYRIQQMMWKSYDQFSIVDKIGLWGNFPLHEWVDYGIDYADNVHNLEDSGTSTDNISQTSIIRKNLLSSSGTLVDRKFAPNAPPIPRAFDLSGNNNHGTLYSGRSIRFPQTGGKMNTGYNLKSNYFFNNFTVALWFKTDSVPSLDQCLFSLYENSNDNFGLYYRTDGKIYLYDDIDGVAEYRYGVYIDPNTWYRIVVVLDNLQPVLYINGVPLRVTGNTWALLPVSDGVDSFESNLFIGEKGSGGPGGSHLNLANMSDFQLWSSAWELEDVVYDYNNPENLITDRGINKLIMRGRNTKMPTGPGDAAIKVRIDSTHLKLWYPFNDSNLPTVKIWDQSGNNNHTTVENVFATTELLSANNQSFESSNITVGSGFGEWNTDPIDSYGAVTFSQSTTVAKDGSNSLKMLRNSVSDIWFAGAIKLQCVPGAGYEFKYSGYNKTGSEQATAMVVNIYGDKDGTPTTIHQASSLFAGLTTDSWVDGTLAFTATSETMWMVMTGLDVGGGDAAIYWDSLSFKSTEEDLIWTDASQQPIIPQTLLQSYNEISHPLTGAGVVSISDHNDFSFGDSSNDTDFTIAAWIYLNGDDQYVTIFEKQNEYHFLVEDQKLKIYIMDETGSHNLNARTSSDLNAHQWYHVAVTAEANESIGDKFHIYLNGVNQTKSLGTTGTYTAMHNTSNAAKIYGNDNFSTTFLEAKHTHVYKQPSFVLDVAVYRNLALGAVMIDVLYNNGSPISPVGIFTSAGYHPATDSTLVGYWRNNGCRTWNDLSGNDRHGTFDIGDGFVNVNSTIRLISQQSSGSHTTGFDGSKDQNGFPINSLRTTNALNFPGGSSYGYVEIPEKTYDIDGSAVTFSFWVKLYSNRMSSDLSPSDTAIFGSDSVDDYKSIYFNSALTRLTIESDTDGNLAYKDFSALSYDTWYNFVIVCPGDGNVLMYKDGETLGTMDDGTIGANITIKYIGKQKSTRELHGQLDDVMIYTSGLSSEDVKRNYNAQITSHK